MKHRPVGQACQAIVPCHEFDLCLRAVLFRYILVRRDPSAFVERPHLHVDYEPALSDIDLRDRLSSQQVVDPSLVSLLSRWIREITFPMPGLDELSERDPGLDQLGR